MGMASFLARPLSYRVASVGALCFGMLMVLGVACPYWYESKDSAYYGGLWSRCLSSLEKCTSLTSDKTEGWWLSLQILEPLAAVCVTVSCSGLLFENCFNDVNSPTMLQEVLGILGGVLGSTGCFIFLGQTEPASSSSEFSHYDWSFYFALVGSVGVLVFSLVVLLGGKTTKKSWRMSEHNGHVSPEPVRRFSQLWASHSPASPQPAARKPIGAAPPSLPEVRELPPASGYLDDVEDA